MAIGITGSQHYANIAAAIRAKNGSENTYKPSEMAAAIKAIKGGENIVLISIYEHIDKFAIFFDDGSLLAGSVEFDENGVPVSLTDDAGDAVTFEDGYPITATDSNGHEVSIIWGKQNVETVTRTVILPETTVTAPNYDVYSACYVNVACETPLVDGETYIVTCDGVEYECTADGTTIGDLDAWSEGMAEDMDHISMYPFSLIWQEKIGDYPQYPGLLIYVIRDGEPHTISVVHVGGA